MSITILGMPLLMVGWLRSYVASHTFQVRIGDVIPKDNAVLSDVLGGSVIGPILLLVMANDTPSGIQLFRRFFANDTKWEERVWI